MLALDYCTFSPPYAHCNTDVAGTLFSHSNKDKSYRHGGTAKVKERESLNYLVEQRCPKPGPARLQVDRKINF